MKKNILFISTLLPYPLNNGGKIKTYNTLKILSESYDIDLICYYENENELKYIENLKEVAKNIDVFKSKITTNDNKKYMCKLALKSLFTSLPLTVLKFFSGNFSQLIHKKIEENKYEKLYIDHLQISINIKNFNLKNLDYILDEHNCEYLIMKRKAKEEKNIFKKIFFGLEYLKLKNYEKNIGDKVNKIIALSENDKKELDNIGIKMNKIKVIPIAFSTDYIKENLNEKKECLNILFLGTMSWMPNYEGVLWFLKNVIPILREEKMNFKFYIVGKGASDEINQYDNGKDIEILGFVEDLNQYFDLCDCMIVPIFFGSGLRVKIIEAFAKKMPVISTTIGAEGLNIENKKNILIADSSKEFLSSLKDINNPKIREKLARNGRIVFENEYSFEAIKNKILKFLKKGE
ncbi:glycosyltransferase family 4 protein [Clostridium sp. LIBA-8841]|uniref:glycosyltransferase n=1 Tax=Clostridium sp. LIBA-8841 TaxID=2987530 RepID=UPI002AC57740|nr:glycosyltransferase family 4 protein [Clostridium sp. LIBA-8841]MDZ5254361.1 glycosyltransferase family 4 protein [Clostridium sp. LIBA-8841]